MGLFSKDIKTMDDLFLHVLQDIYYAENQIVKALPDMIEKATNRELTAAFKSHLERDRKAGATARAGVRAARARARRGPSARRSTASSTRPRKSPARSTTRRCWMPP